MGTVSKKTGDARDRREHLLELVKDFDTAFLVTHSGEGLHGRPMGLAEVTDSGEIYFSTGYSDPKTREIAADSQAGVFMQGKTRWVALSGKATVVKDRALVERLWNESWKLWFPEGKDDPNIAFVRFDPASGEYWDNSGRHGIRFVIEAAKAYLQGREPDGKAIDENAKVRL